jgi:hypothetical protein
VAEFWPADKGWVDHFIMPAGLCADCGAGFHENFSAGAGSHTGEDQNCNCACNIEPRRRAIP